MVMSPSTSSLPKVKILKLLKLLPWLEEQLAEKYEVVELPAGISKTDFFIQHGVDIRGLVTSGVCGVDKAIIDQLPNLEIISSFGVGLDKIDVDYAKSKNIRVGYTPDVLNDCVADLAFALLLGLGRKVVAGDQFIRSGSWSSGKSGAFPLGFQVSKAKLGIVGMGRIGSTIAKRSIGFDMDVRYHARNPVLFEAWTYEPSLIELAKWSDFLVVITSGGVGTKHLINAEVLNALGPRGFLINVSRGSVVDEVALIDALQTKKIAGAALDVFENEPFVPEVLYKLDNVVMVPHIASATNQTRLAMANRVLDNLDSFFNEKSMPSEI
jgi:hydroxypyruvate reductase